jgi:tetratricopeptide (TPR) repeat protein
VFFVHNLVDFSLAEPGPLLLFAMLLGAVLGVRTTWTGASQHRAFAIAALAGGVVLWIVTILGFVLPVADAEGTAQSGDDAMRAIDPADPDKAAVAAARAAAMYRSAYERLPLNADYAFRSARAMIFANDKPEKVRIMLDTAIGRDPNEVAYYLTRAAYATRQGEVESAKRDYEKALALDPNDVAMRLDYAGALVVFNDRAAAIRQYKLALEKNGQLHPDEPKRLPPARIEDIRRRIAELEAKP